MDQKIKTNRDHPYTQYENSKEWDVISMALKELSENDDLVIRTAETHVIGYLVQSLIGYSNNLKK